ncbi:MAG: hypothetical protein GY717_08665 [Rhodobacteraceae bacterium]|nr:hypothetical protein [Paracoccaceae bacterium]
MNINALSIARPLNLVLCLVGLAAFSVIYAATHSRPEVVAKAVSSVVVAEVSERFPELLMNLGAEEQATGSKLKELLKRGHVELGEQLEVARSAEVREAVDEFVAAVLT